VTMYGCAQHMVLDGFEDNTLFWLCFYRLQRSLGAKLVKNCVSTDDGSAIIPVKVDRLLTHLWYVIIPVVDSQRCSVSFLESKERRHESTYSRQDLLLPDREISLW
jgi:hypothetical protein